MTQTSPSGTKQFEWYFLPNGTGILKLAVGWRVQDLRAAKTALGPGYKLSAVEDFFACTKDHDFFQIVPNEVP